MRDCESAFHCQVGLRIERLAPYRLLVNETAVGWTSSLGEIGRVNASKRVKGGVPIPMRNLTVMRFRLCELPTPAVLRINDGEGKRQDEGAAGGDCEGVAAVGKGQGLP